LVPYDQVKEFCVTFLFGIRERKRFIVLSGEVGTIKITLLWRMITSRNWPVFLQRQPVTFTGNELLSIKARDGFPSSELFRSTVLKLRG
jgi:hypothetical protein